MKYLILFCIIAFCPALAAAQDSINPYVIHQRGNIILHNTNVYYNPFAPPDPAIWRGQLCNESLMLMNPDGISAEWPGYQPMVHSAGELHDTALMNWQPYGTPLGQFAVWQRLFQSLNGDIVAGGNTGDSVIISKGEDVDFRAHGRVKLKNGFRAMAGCRFHGYTEPKWGDSVFSDEFNDSAKFANQWHVSNGYGGNNYPEGAQSVYDSNVRLVTDPDAHDGYAVDIMLREDTVNKYSCPVLEGYPPDTCGNIPDPSDTIPQKFIFSAGMIRSCPFPFMWADTPHISAYAHAPYGKYEVREKIPHVLHHTNNWGGGQNYGFEYDINETDYGGNMGIIQPDLNHKLWRGPYYGHFGWVGDTIIFVSPAAHWCPSNNPEGIVINNVPYGVQFFTLHGMDTVCATGLVQSQWPSSLYTSTDSFSFYYSIVSNCFADSLTWNVSTDGSGKWRIFSAAYHDSSGTLLHFSKWNQPTWVKLTTDTILGTKKTFNCHWAYSLNNPIDSGKLLLDDTGMATGDLKSGVEAYGFRATDLYSSPGYPVPPVPFNGNDTTGHYEYHTFGMEWLPHEVRFLVDSVVVRRFPDRLVPPGNPYYDWISTLPRTLSNILPAEIDMDFTPPDTLGTNSGLDSNGWWGDSSIAYAERKYFEHAASVELASPVPGWPGFEMVDGKPVAHHLIDYVKVWDVPADVKIPDLPPH